MAILRLSTVDLMRQIVALMDEGKGLDDAEVRMKIADLQARLFDGWVD